MTAANDKVVLPAIAETANALRINGKCYHRYTPAPNDPAAVAAANEEQVTETVAQLNARTPPPIWSDDCNDCNNTGIANGNIVNSVTVNTAAIVGMTACTDAYESNSGYYHLWDGVMSANNGAYRYDTTGNLHIGGKEFRYAKIDYSTNGYWELQIVGGGGTVLWRGRNYYAENAAGIYTRTGGCCILSAVAVT